MANLGDNKNVYNHLLFVANMLRNNSRSTTTFMSIMNHIYLSKDFIYHPAELQKIQKRIANGYFYMSKLINKNSWFMISTVIFIIDIYYHFCFDPYLNNLCFTNT